MASACSPAPSGARRGSAATPIFTCFEGLIAAALPFAHEKLAEREKRKQAENERLTRKRPKFTVVSNNTE
jgi:hypothetical protein